MLHFGKQVQGRRIVLLEAGRQLVHQTRLGLNQRILIARQGFQFLQSVTIRLQSAQLGQVKAAYFRQQMRVNLIGLGSCRFAQLIGGLRVHRIDGDTSFQQERDQQSMVGFDNTRQVLGLSRNTQQKLFQRVQAFMAVGKASRSHALARFIHYIHVMMGVRPIQANVPHTRDSLSRATPGVSGPSITGARSTSLQSSIGPGKLPREARSFLIGRAVWRTKSFPGSAYRAGIHPADPCS